MRFLTEYALRLDAQREPIDCRLRNPVAELIDWITLVIKALHDSKRAPVDCRAEEARDGRVAQVLCGKCERGKLSLLVLEKARIQKFKTDEFLALAGSNSDRSLSQLVHKVHVRQLEQT